MEILKLLLADKKSLKVCKIHHNKKIKYFNKKDEKFTCSLCSYENKNSQEDEIPFENKEILKYSNASLLELKKVKSNIIQQNEIEKRKL